MITELSEEGVLPGTNRSGHFISGKTEKTHFETAVAEGPDSSPQGICQAMQGTNLSLLPHRKKSAKAAVAGQQAPQRCVTSPLAMGEARENTGFI